MKKQCNFCGNKSFKKRDVQYMYKQNGHFLVVNNVPCEECEFCGEQYFRAAVLKKIEKDFQQIYTAGKKSKGMLKVPVEEFADI